MDWISSPLCVLIIFGTIYKVFELFVRKEERLMLLKKIEEIKNVNINGLYMKMNSGPNHKFLSLRSGMLALGTGLGFLIGQLLMINFLPNLERYGYSNYRSLGSPESVFITSCVLIGGGLALVISYMIERNNTLKDKENRNESATEE